MDQKTEKRRKFLIDFFFFATIAILIILFFKYAISYILPFIIGFIIASIVRPLQKFITKHLKINHKFVSTILVTLLYGLVILAIYYISSSIINEVIRLSHNMPAIVANLPGYFEQLSNKFYELVSSIHPELATVINNSFDGLISSLVSKLGSGSLSVLTSATGVAMNIPSYFITTVVSIISGYLISANYDMIMTFVKKQIPERFNKIISTVYEHLALTVFKMLRAYAMILSITFIELTIGFLIIGVDYALLLALLIAFIDILPVLGVGTVLIPWGVASLFMGNIKLGVSLILLYVIILAVRQYLEPKVVGAQIGLNPLVTLICIFIGFKLAGLIGVFLLPLTMIILKKLNEDGTIHLWKSVPPDPDKKVRRKPLFKKEKTE